MNTILTGSQNCLLVYFFKFWLSFLLFIALRFIGLRWSFLYICQQVPFGFAYFAAALHVHTKGL